MGLGEWIADPKGIMHPLSMMLPVVPAPCPSRPECQVMHDDIDNVRARVCLCLCTC